MLWNHSSLKVIHFAINHRPTRGRISSYNVAGLLWSFRRSNHPNRQKLPSSTTPLSFNAPSKTNPREYRHAPYGLWSIFFIQICALSSKTRIFCTRVRFGRSRSSEVDDFDTNRKRVSKARMRLPISLLSFLRSGDLFLLPLFHSVSSLPTFPLKFRGEDNHEETKVCGAILQWRPHDRSLSRFNMIPACDRQTNGRTESIIQRSA